MAERRGCMLSGVHWIRSARPRTRNGGNLQQALNSARNALVAVAPLTAEFCKGLRTPPEFAPGPQMKEMVGTLWAAL